MVYCIVAPVLAWFISLNWMIFFSKRKCFFELNIFLQRCSGLLLFYDLYFYHLNCMGFPFAWTFTIWTHVLVIHELSTTIFLSIYGHHQNRNGQIVRIAERALVIHELLIFSSVKLAKGSFFIRTCHVYQFEHFKICQEFELFTTSTDERERSNMCTYWLVIHERLGSYTWSQNINFIEHLKHITYKNEVRSYECWWINTVDFAST